MGFKRKKDLSKIKGSSPLSKSGRKSHLHIKRLSPLLVGVLDELHKAHITHQVQSDHCDHVGERLPRLRLFPDHHYQQLGHQYAVDLHLDSIGALSPEVPQREVLLYLFEQAFDHPTVFVYDRYLFRGHPILKYCSFSTPWASFFRVLSTMTFVTWKIALSFILVTNHTRRCVNFSNCRYALYALSKTANYRDPTSTSTGTYGRARGPPSCAQIPSPR